MNFVREVGTRVLTALCAMVAAVASAGTVTYYHDDLLGSPNVATNASGQVVWRESYRPYGERLADDPASANNRIWFTSRRQDAETGLVYLGARYYEPVAGRFLSVDPKGFDEKNIHSHNRYAYANNNPLRFVDIDGREPGDMYQRGYAVPIPVFSQERGLEAVHPEFFLLPVLGSARLAASAAAIDGELTSAGGQLTYKIIDGVRRSKAAELAGNITIKAEIEGAPGQVSEIPISSLRSPKEVIETSGSGFDRWRSVVDAARAGEELPPVLLRRGSSGIPIKDVKVQGE